MFQKSAQIGLHVRVAAECGINVVEANADCSTPATPFFFFSNKKVKMYDIIIIEKIKMCKISHSSALCGRELALPYKTGNHSNAGKNTPQSPTRAPHATANRRRAELWVVILYIKLYYAIIYRKL